MTITMIFSLILSFIVGGGIGYFLGRSIYEYLETGDNSSMIVAITTFVAWVFFIIVW